MRRAGCRPPGRGSSGRIRSRSVAGRTCPPSPRLGFLPLFLLSRPLSLWLRPWLELDLAVGPRHPSGELVTPLALGIQLMAEEESQVGDPKPDQHDHDAAQGPVGLVVGPE